MTRSLESRQLVIFFGLAYGIAWLFFLLLGLSRAGLGWIPLTLSLPVMSVLGTLAPSLSALITLRATEHRWPRKRSITNPRRWFLTMLLCAPLLCLTFAILPAILLAKAPWTLHWSALLSLSVFSYSTLIGGPLGEEPGWRGFALPRLEKMMAPWKASLLLGTLWACWHLPLFLCLSWSSSSIPYYILIVLGLSGVMTFLFNLSGQSLIVAILVHAMFNTVSRWLAALLGDQTLRDRWSPELVMGLCGVIIASVLMVVTRGNLAYLEPKMKAQE